VRVTTVDIPVQANALREPGKASFELAPLRQEEQPAPTRGVYAGRGKGLKASEVSSSCADTAKGALWFCANDKWFAGENREAELTHPGSGPGKALRGTDLGASVRFGPRRATYFYMGDSFGRMARGTCGLERHQDFCNDAVLVAELDTTSHPEQGVPAKLAMSDSNAQGEDGFVPIVIDGINGRNPLPLCRQSGKKPSFGPPCLGIFNTPTGALSTWLTSAALLGKSDEAQEVVLMWFATAQAMFDEPKGRTLAASWLVVSTDGVSFRKLLDAPFSREKFINVSPVLLTVEHRRRLCDRGVGSPLCHASLKAQGDIALLFGAGQRYRKSPLYLAALDLSTMKTRYYSGESNQPWAVDESSAAPVIGTLDPRPVDQFGELSVGLVPAQQCPADVRNQCEDTLVLLANQAGFIRYRTAPLAQPSSWSAQRKSSGIGYGPYIIEALTKVDKSPKGGLELVLYHLVSSWDGKPLKTKKRNPYGVFTRRLLIVGDETCGDDDLSATDCLTHPPLWPANGSARAH
jgi:hypothetical protein